MINLSKTKCAAGGTLAVMALALAALSATAIPAGATTATATLTAGSLGFIGTPANLTFPSTALTGVNQTLTASAAIDIGDASGSGVGWNLTATSTTFTSGANLLPVAATTIGVVPSVASCDASSTCAPATASAVVTYPYSLPSGATAPTATKMYSATAGTGLGDQTLTPTWTLAVPSKSLAGAYTATWTISIVSGP
jgi:hypothetical protein